MKIANFSILEIKITLVLLIAKLVDNYNGFIEIDVNWWDRLIVRLTITQTRQLTVFRGFELELQQEIKP